MRALQTLLSTQTHSSPLAELKVINKSPLSDHLHSWFFLLLLLLLHFSQRRLHFRFKSHLTVEIWKLSPSLPVIVILLTGSPRHSAYEYSKTLLQNWKSELWSCHIIQVITAVIWSWKIRLMHLDFSPTLQCLRACLAINQIFIVQSCAQPQSRWRSTSGVVLHHLPTSSQWNPINRLGHVNQVLFSSHFWSAHKRVWMIWSC